MSDMDITGFLTACVKDDEDYALNACQFVGAEWHEPFSGAVQFGGQDTNPECEMALTHDSGISRHMERHDPARVLREVAAKRRVLARHVPSTGEGPYDPYCLGCGEIDGYWPRSDSVNDCPELRDMASVYADRPGYKEEWKPAEAEPAFDPKQYWATLRKHEQEAREAAGETPPANMWKAPEEGGEG